MTPAADGTFRVEGVVPGTYSVHVVADAPEDAPGSRPRVLTGNPDRIDVPEKGEIERVIRVTDVE